MTKRAPNPRSLDPGAQLLQLRAAGLTHAHGQLTMQGLEFEFDTSPLPGSRTYRVRIAYKRGSRPRVTVHAPDLFELAKGRRPPHLYLPFTHPAHLCVFHPDRGEWGPTLSIADTIVPWTVEWLFYFEAWLASGEWAGGGEHPPNARVRYADRVQARWRNARLLALGEEREPAGSPP